MFIINYKFIFTIQLIIVYKRHSYVHLVSSFHEYDFNTEKNLRRLQNKYFFLKAALQNYFYFQVKVHVRNDKIHF